MTDHQAKMRSVCALLMKPVSEYYSVEGYVKRGWQVHSVELLGLHGHKDYLRVNLRRSKSVFGWLSTECVMVPMVWLLPQKYK